MRLIPIPERALGVALGISLLAGITAGCASTQDDDAAQGTVVVASTYPLAWLAEQIGGDDVTVVNLTPPGVEPHDLEPSSDDLETIGNAHVVLYIGSGFQPSIERAVEGNPTALDLLEGRELLDTPLGESDTITDPHVWLDPSKMRDMANDVRNALVEADPSGEETFATNLRTVDAALASLDHEFETSLEDCKSRAIVTAHAAFAYLAARYNLQQYPVVVSPDAEPDPAELNDLVELVEVADVSTIFTETLASPRVAETLAAEAGVTTEVLDPLEGLTPDAAAAGEDYLSVMRDNMLKLRAALGCTATSEEATA